MKEAHIKIFTGSPVIVNHLRSLLHEHGIDSICKNHDESARVAGFGSFVNLAELFILNIDLEKANPIIEDFKREIA